MKDSHIALIGGAASWVVLVGGVLGVPAAMVGAQKAAHQRVLDQRGMTADVAATIGDVATLKIPKGFVRDGADDMNLTPEMHEDPDAAAQSWVLGPRTRPFWAPDAQFGPPPQPAATLTVTIADPMSNVMEMQRLDFEAAPFSNVGPVDIVKSAVMTAEDVEKPSGVRYLGQNAAAGFSADLTLDDPKLYTDAQARDLLVSVLGSLQVTPSKFDALLAGPRQRQADELAAREEMRAQAVAQVTKQLGLTAQKDESLLSPAGDVLADGVLYLRLDARKAPAGAKPGAASYRLAAPISDDMTTTYGERDEAMLQLFAVSGDGAGGFLSTMVVSNAYAAENGPHEPEPFAPPPALAGKLKANEVTLLRAMYLDDIADGDGLEVVMNMVRQSQEWRAAKVKKWVAQ